MAEFKGLVTRYQGYGADDAGSHVVYDSRSASQYLPNSDKGTSEAADVAASVLNRIRAERKESERLASEMSQQSSKKIKGASDTSVSQSMVDGSLHIYRNAPVANNFNTYGQSAAQGLKDLHSLMDGDTAVIYDTEMLGTLPHHRRSNSLDFYEPTEFAFQSFEMDKGTLKAQEGKALSLLLKPSEDGGKRLRQMINTLDSSKWTGLTDDERRVLSDLTLYSGDTDKLFTTVTQDGKRITTVNEQARYKHPLEGSVLKSSENISAMHKGLDNLISHGTEPTDAVQVINDMFESTKPKVVGGYNTLSFDQPLMLDFAARLNQGEFGTLSGQQKQDVDLFGRNMGRPQVDGFQVLKAMEKKPFTKYGKTLKLDQMKNRLGMTGVGQAHHGLSDVLVTGAQFNRLLSSEYSDIMNQSGIDATPFQVGDHLFAHSGITTRNKGKYDGVYRPDEMNNLSSAYNMSTNPLYANTTYRIENLYDGIEIEGKKQFGVELFNERDGLVHTLMRDTQQELQAAIHGTMRYVETPDGRHEFAGNLQNQDRAARRWNKMFSMESGGGVGLANRMYEALDTVRALEIDKDAKGNPITLPDGQYRKTQPTDKAIENAILQLNEWNTPEFVRDFKEIRPRLEGEEDWLRGFMNKMNDSPLAGNTPADSRAQSMALIEFKKLTDAQFGRNEVQRELAMGGSALPLEGDRSKHYVNLSTPDKTRGGLRGFLYQDGTGGKITGIQKKRFKDMLQQLKSLDALNAKQFEQYFNSIDSYTKGDSFETMLTEISNSLVRARENNSMNGALSHIAVEDPTQVRRATDMAMFDDISNKAIGGVQPFTMAKSSTLQLTGAASDIMKEHDAAIRQMLSRNGMDAKYDGGEEAIRSMLKSYEDQGLNVQLRYDGKRKGLQMVLANSEVSNAIMNGDMEAIMNHNGTAVVDLPRMEADGTISRGAQSRVGHIIGEKRRTGYHAVTGFDEAMRALKMNARSVKESLDLSERDGRKDGMNRVHQRLNSSVRRTLQNLSNNNKYINPNDIEDQFKVSSKASNWAAGGRVDISDFAEDWYVGWYDRLSPEMRQRKDILTPEKIRERAKNNHEKFSQNMGAMATRMFHRESDEFVKMKAGWDVSQDSVKDTHAGNFLRSTRDIRDLTPGGYKNPMARENIQKSVNYQALDVESVRRNLSAQVDPVTGERMFNESEITRMLNRSYVTERALDVMEEFTTPDQTSYVSMDVAYMSDKQIAEKAESLVEKYQHALDNAQSGTERKHYESMLRRVQNPESLSTYDGMMLMSKEAASAFDRTQQKLFKLTPGAELTEDIQDIFARTSGEDFDPTRSYTLEKGVGVGPKGSERITISNLAKEEVVNGEIKKTLTPDKVVDKWYMDDLKIMGWDAESQTLIMDRNIKNMDGTKFNSDAGDRVTMTGIETELIEDLSGVKGARAIMPLQSTGKGMEGTIMDAQVGRVIDAAVQQMDIEGRTYTVGDMKKDDALDAVSELFRKHFGIEDESLAGSRTLDNMSVAERVSVMAVNQDMMKENNNYNMKNLHGFIEESSEVLGVDLMRKDSDVIAGRLGIGAANVDDWENRIGDTDGRDGLVKYGRREVDMIQTNAKQILQGNAAVQQKLDGGGSIAVNRWLDDYFSETIPKQSQDARRIARGIYETVHSGGQGKPGEGDIVFRTTGRAFEGDDPKGIGVGRTTADGVREISMHNIMDTPDITAKNALHIPEDYARTIVDFGRIDGTFEDGTTFGQAFEQTGGTAYMELPDDTFSRSHLHMVDQGDVTRGGRAARAEIQDIQKLEQNIWTGIKDYQNASGLTGQEAEAEMAKIRNRIEDSMSKHQEMASRMASNARDNGLSKRLGVVSMDMAGRFKGQGVNPLGNYEVDADGNWNQKSNAVYKEGVAYLGRDSILDMIHGQEQKIANEFFDLDRVTMGTMSKAEIQSHIIDGLDPEKGKGLYGFINRYPTINQATVQAMEIRLDPFAEENSRTMRFAPGTAQRMNADYDGDFYSAVLTQYKSGNAQEIHQEMGILAQSSRELGEEAGRTLVSDYASEFDGVSKHMTYTVQDMVKAASEAQTKAPDMRTSEDNAALQLWEGIESKVSESRRIETVEARQGKGFVGIIDNTRDKTLGLAEATLGLLENEGRLDRETVTSYRNTIEEATSAFSQNLISSKKFNVETEIDRLMENHGLERTEATAQAHRSIQNRHNVIDEMNNALLNLTDENRNVFEQHNAAIGLFDVNDADSMKTMNQSLDMIQDIQRWTSKTGGSRNSTLAMGVSSGMGAESAEMYARGLGDATVPNRQNLLWSEVLSGTSAGDAIDESIDVFNRTTLQTFDDMTNASNTIEGAMDGGGRRSRPMTGATMAESGATSLRSMASKVMPDVGISRGGLIGGAVGFGAMWAGSALVRGGPTPEGLEEQTQQTEQPPASIQNLSMPTARVIENTSANGEHLNIRINAQEAQGMSQDQMASVVQNEIQNMLSAQMTTTLNINDNTQSLDTGWLQGVVSNAIDKGYAF